MGLSLATFVTLAYWVAALFVGSTATGTATATGTGTGTATAFAIPPPPILSSARATTTTVKTTTSSGGAILAAAGGSAANGDVDEAEPPAATLMTATSTAASRRQFWVGASSAVVVAAAAAGLPPGATAAAAAASDAGGVVGSCPRGSQNCIRTTWTAPSGASKKQAVQSLRDAIESYPQEGQSGVDLGGWALVEPGFFSADDASGKVARIEYTSGIGNFAKFLNGGKPFVDDVLLSLQQQDDGACVVQVKSSSRVGDSDLGVNEKRLRFLASQLRSAGWDAPEPKY